MSGPATTQIQDTLYAPDGSVANGYLIISTSVTFESADGFTLLRGYALTIPVVDGVVNVELVPNEGTTPNSSYQVSYQLTQHNFVRTWYVPASETPLTLSSVLIS